MPLILFFWNSPGRGDDDLCCWSLHWKKDTMIFLFLHILYRWGRMKSNKDRSTYRYFSLMPLTWGSLWMLLVCIPTVTWCIELNPYSPISHSPSPSPHSPSFTLIHTPPRPLASRITLGRNNFQPPSTINWCRNPLHHTIFGKCAGRQHISPHINPETPTGTTHFNHALLQHISTQCTIKYHTRSYAAQHISTQCNTLHHKAIHLLCGTITTCQHIRP